MASPERGPADAPRGFVVARIAGIDLHLDGSWFIALAVLTLVARRFITPAMLAETDTAAAWGLSALLGAAISACIVFHEAAHAAVARAYGMRVRRITLFLFGGVAQIEHEAPRPRAEFAVALAGPLASVVLGAVLAGVARALNPGTEGFVGPWGVFASLNIAVAVFNLVPAFPMDGGRLLRSILWRTLRRRALATRYAVIGGRTFAFLLVAGGVALIGLTAFRDLSGLYTILIGVFLYNAAGTAGRIEGGEHPNAPGLPLPGVSLGDDDEMTAAGRDGRAP